MAYNDHPQKKLTNKSFFSLILYLLVSFVKTKKQS